MEIVDNSTTSEDFNKNQTKDILCDQNSMSVIKNHDKIKHASEKNLNKKI